MISGEREDRNEKWDRLRELHVKNLDLSVE